MASKLRTTLFTALIYAAFFASGAGSLMAEVTWNRMLIVVVGNSLSATAMIIVVFMGGLGLGSFIGGRWFATRRASLTPYLLMEAAVGTYVLFSSVLFGSLSGLFTSLAGVVHSPASLTLVRIGVTLAALLLPACVMGATFPAMISGAVSGTLTQRSARTGYLYSINTLGAAIGCFAAGYHLLLEFGVRITLDCAFGLYLLAALCALAASRLGDLSRAAKGAPVPAEPVPEVSAPPGVTPAGASASAADRGPGREPLGTRALAGPETWRFLAVATFGIGFVALAYEVLLTRLSILYLGNSVSVFPLVLTGFLLGTGISAVLGTRLYGAFCKDPRSGGRFFGVLSFGAGVAVMAIPYLLLTDRFGGANQIAGLADALPRNPWPIVGVIVAPTMLLGAMLPVAIRMLRPDDPSGATRGAATLYALNTAGGLIGAGLANHYLVPLFGTQGVLISLTAICMAVAAAGFLSSRTGWRRWPASLAAAAVLALVLALTLPKIVDLYSTRVAQATGARSAQVRLIREGRAATVTVVDQDDPALGTYRDMYLNGVEEASTRYWHTQLFKLLGVLPILSHESGAPKEVLVIAFGAGITAGSALAPADVAALDVVDLNPDVQGINDLFTEVNGDVYHQPRFHFHHDDGRNYLVTCGKSYDVIINDSTHPRAYDSWILYTEEFYRSVKRRLKPGGVFAQWVPVLGSMQGELFQIHLNTFRRAFPHTTCWYIYGSDQAFLMATPETFSLDVARLQPQLDRLAPWFRAREYQLASVTDVAGFFWLDEKAMDRMIGKESRINTDNAHYFDKQSAIRPSPPQRRLPFFQASVLPHLRGADPALRSAVRARQELGLQLALYGFFESRDDLFRAYCAHADDEDVRYFMAREFAGNLPDREPFCRDQEIRQLREIVRQHPKDPMSLNALADVLASAGQYDEASDLVRQALSVTPREGMILDTYGWILYKQGKKEQSLDVLRQSLSLLPNHPIVHYHLGAVYLALGNAREGRRLLERALQLSQNFEGAPEARALLRD